MRDAPRTQRTPPVRDMDASPFASILADLVARIPGAYAAALVDREGETVDYSGVVEPFDVRVAAAHLRILLNDCEGISFWGAPRLLIIRGEKKSTIMRGMPEGYAVSVMLKKRAGFASSMRAFAVCARALAREANWPVEEDSRIWSATTVQCDERGRPVNVIDRDVAHPVVVLGSVQGLLPRERGFRVRTLDGNEITLVREAGAQWYTDEPPAGATSIRP